MAQSVEVIKQALIQLLDARLEPDLYGQNEEARATLAGSQMSLRKILPGYSDYADRFCELILSLRYACMKVGAARQKTSCACASMTSAVCRGRCPYDGFPGSARPAGCLYIFFRDQFAGR